ncbi:DNA glycosylase [Lipomyces arxii]|uniref:DNA glycosylase n=1 Tax=Lipomyces arxii TaxID=56418 RepID=UPI0034CF63A8
MRKRIPAPVDSMGCHVLPPDIVKTNSVASQNLQILLSLLLSSQTKDQYTFGSMQALRAHFQPLEITPERILALDDIDLDRIIKTVGFHAKKTIYMKKISALLLGNEFKGKIPTDLDVLVKRFPGIGPKMGILYLQNAKLYPDDTQDGSTNEIEYGLAVDTHVLRLSQQFRLVFPPSKGATTVTPEIARAQLEKIVPKEHWKDANPLLVGFGQTVCGARSKMCGDCVIAGTGLCKAEIKSSFNKVKLESNHMKNEKALTVESTTTDIPPKVRKRKFKAEISRVLQNFAYTDNLVPDIEDTVGSRRLRSQK